MAGGLLQRADLAGVVRLHAAAGAGDSLVAGIGRGELFGEVQLLRGVLRHAEGGEVFVHEGLERAVRQAVGRAVDELAGIARFGHECRAVGDLVDTRLQLHGLGHVLRADHIQDRGRVLHDVGAAAAGVEDGIVDARVVGHMLAQKLHADVHELDRVQRAPAQLRRARRVGGDAVEGVLHLDAGVRAAGDDLVAVLRVPGERGVELLPEAVARHESLGCAALFAGAAVERDGAGAAGLLQPGLDADRGGQRARAQQIVPAAVAGAAGRALGVDQLPALLREAGQRVILGQNADMRPPGAKARGKRGGDAAHALLHAEALLL